MSHGPTPYATKISRQRLWSHLGQRRREWIPSSRITTVSHMWRCTKCTQSALRLVASPGQPPTRHVMVCAPSSNEIRYVPASSGGWGGGGVIHLPLGQPILDLSVSLQ